jgi:hypothetical protein
MSVSIEEQVRQLGKAFSQFVEDVEVGEVIDHASAGRLDSDITSDSLGHLNGHEIQFEELTTTGQRSTAVNTPIALIAACCILIAGVAGILVVVNRPAAPTAAPPSVVSPPAWYAALEPLLPDEFDHVAILGSNDSHVQFEAFDTDSSKSLIITVSRSAMSPDPSGFMTLEQARSEPWTDAGIDHNISLPDGRQIGLLCTFRPMPDGHPGCPDINGLATDPEVLRTFALALANDLSPDTLPSPTEELDHVPATEIRRAIGQSVPAPETGSVEAPHYGFSFVQRGDIEGPEFVSVRTVSGFYPPVPSRTARVSATAGEFRLTWQAVDNDTIWYVSDSTAQDHDVAAEILDRATG